MLPVRCGCSLGTAGAAASCCPGSPSTPYWVVEAELGDLRLTASPGPEHVGTQRLRTFMIPARELLCASCRRFPPKTGVIPWFRSKFPRTEGSDGSCDPDGDRKGQAVVGTLLSQPHRDSWRLREVV